MHITKVIVEGFKSYRNKTILKIEPGLNVIVGRNGAGKTNLFFAIQFVLSHEYQSLPERQRIDLLHASSALRATSAYVEIVFNNEDRHLPEEEDIVKLRREITLTDDVYSLNGHKVGKAQVQRTLQSAGLSKVNPYYIIKQGRINDLAIATGEKRLTLLKEIAGSLVWEELRRRDYPILNNDEKLINEFEKWISEIEQTIEILKKDEEDYHRWLEINTHKRVMEFLLCKREHTRIVDRLTQLKTQLNNAHTEEKTVRAETEQRAKEKLETEGILKSYQFEFRSAQEKLKSLTDLVQELASEHSRLELELSDRRERLVTDKGELLQNDLIIIDNEILIKKEELARISDEYNAALKEEFEINTRLMLNEQRRQQLFAKLGRKASFTSVAERNQWIIEEQRKLNNLVDQQSKQLEEILNDIADEESIAKTLGTEIDRLEIEKTGAFESLLALNKKKQEAELEQRRLQMLRNELWRKEREAQDELHLSTQDWEKSMNNFRRVVPAAAAGMDFMASTLQKMREEREGSFAYNCALAYRGLFIDQFSCGEEISSAIDAVAGGSLFHHVVDTDVAASEILRHINMQRLPGTYVFFAHNRLGRKNVGSINDENAVPMIRVLEHINDGMMVVMEQVFGRVLLCKDYDSAVLTARRYNVDCVTLEGDTIKRNGVLSGGYYSPHRSRTRLYLSLKEAQKLRETKKSKLKEAEEQIRNADSLFNDNTSTLQRIEIKISNTKLDVMEEDLKKFRRALSVSTQALEGKNTLSRKLTMSLQANRAKIESLENELLQEFASELTVDERVEVDMLNQEIQQAHKMFKNVSGRRLELESQKNLIESKLSDHLMKKKCDLEQLIQEKSASGLNTTEANLRALKNMETHLNKLQTRLHKGKDEMAVLEARIAEMSEKVIIAENELKICQDRKQNQQALLDKQIAAVNKICQSIDRNETNEKTYSEQLKSLGSFAEESEKEILDRYSDYDVKRLEKELTKVNDRLKGHKKINQQATLEYAVFKNTLDDLSRKLYRLNENQMDCVELIESVESQKNDAIQYSLMQVAKSFRSMFRTLVPSPAIGYMEWIYGDDDDSGSDLDAEDPRVPDPNRLRGVSVNVSFTGASNVRDLNSLSGGQRSIVSLALVFAILMMDRAPFYLLDEADMALDSAYRSKVAAMVGKFAKKSQFIATTFRSELLDHASNIIGVTYDASVQTSRATSISKVEASDFISHGSESSGSASLRSHSPISSSTVSL